MIYLSTTGHWVGRGRRVLAGVWLAVLPLLAYAQAPGVAALAPRLGRPGATIALRGTNLGGATAVVFTGAAGPKEVNAGFVVNAAGTAITGLVVPLGAQSGPVRVVTPGGTSAGNVVFFRAKSFAAGNAYSVATRSDSLFLSWGINAYGQLGANGTNNRFLPNSAGTHDGWVGVAAGFAHTAGIQANGTLWTWGFNNFGGLGNGTTTSRLTEAQVGTATNWVDVAVGTAHTVALRANGTLWAWGYNLSGQVGDGSTTNRLSPLQIGTATNWTSVAAGPSHTVALRADGTLWAWGANNGGQLGDGTTTDRPAPRQVGTATNWVAATAAFGNTLALRADGTLWAWGGNGSGQLGDGTTTDRLTPAPVGTATNWMAVSMSAAHVAAVQADGTLWTWGFNRSGQLGNGNQTNALTPAQVGTATTWTGASAGFDHTLGEQTCHAIWAWGANDTGQLGTSTSPRALLAPTLAVAPPAPSFSSFVPFRAAVGATVGVVGRNLTGLTSFSVNGANVPVASLINPSPTGFSFVVPAGATARGTTVLTSNCGSGTSLNFTVLQPTASRQGIAPVRFSLAPNPACGGVAVANAPAKASVRLTDALGRTVATATTDAAGTARLALPAGLAAGVYVVRCAGQAQRLVVE